MAGHLLIRSDARRLPLADASVHCCITSPPYYGLRNYGCDGQIGLEPSPDAYVAAMVAVFREVERVLRSDGTAWVNMGDSYAGSSKGGNPVDSPWAGYTSNGDHAKGPAMSVPIGLKAKDVLGMPWRLALALQADGWYLRSSIVWSKAEVGEDDELEGSAMPGSQRDRPTSAHDLIFLLSKSARYYYDPEACQTKSGAMLRDVWRMNPEAFPGAHFATFPRELPRRAILLGTSERGVCTHCGKPWTRIVEREPQFHARVDAIGRRTGTALDADYRGIGLTRSKHLGWRPGCACDAGEPIPATVLDPFVGSGTTIIVANALGRRAIGLDLSAEYLAMARRRIHRPHARAERPVRAAEMLPLFDGIGRDANPPDARNPPML